MAVGRRTQVREGGERSGEGSGEWQLVDGQRPWARQARALRRTKHFFRRCILFVVAWQLFFLAQRLAVDGFRRDPNPPRAPVGLAPPQWKWKGKRAFLLGGRLL